MLATSVTSECLAVVILGLLCPLDTQQSKMKCTEHTGQWLTLSYGETADMDPSALPSPPQPVHTHNAYFSGVVWPVHFRKTNFI